MIDNVKLISVHKILPLYVHVIELVAHGLQLYLAGMVGQCTPYNTAALNQVVEDDK